MGDVLQDGKVGDQQETVRGAGKLTFLSLSFLMKKKKRVRPVLLKGE